LIFLKFDVLKPDVLGWSKKSWSFETFNVAHVIKATERHFIRAFQLSLVSRFLQQSFYRHICRLTGFCLVISTVHFSIKCTYLEGAVIRKKEQVMHQWVGVSEVSRCQQQLSRLKPEWSNWLIVIISQISDRSSEPIGCETPQRFCAWYKNDRVERKERKKIKHFQIQLVHIEILETYLL
jgi:hypothetical protein